MQEQSSQCENSAQPAVVKGNKVSWLHAGEQLSRRVVPISLIRLYGVVVTNTDTSTQFLPYWIYVMCRFTKDTESVDTSVSYSVQSFMTCSISVFGAILVVTAVTPTIVVAIALLGIVYYRVQVSTLALMLVCLFFGVRKHENRRNFQKTYAIPTQT